MKKALLVGGGILVVLLFLTGTVNGMLPWVHPLHTADMHDSMSVEEMRGHFISLKEDLQDRQRPMHQYRCCLEDACTYCIEKSPGHGEGAACDCLSDVVNGVHPCGECIGEILEGHGSPYLAEYFAEAIAEEVGEQHIDTLREIVMEKYGMAVEDRR